MTIHFSDEQDDPLESGPLVALAQQVLTREGFDADAEVAIALVSTERIEYLNENHRGGSGPTDVLAFPLEPLRPGDRVVRQPNGPPVVLGDIFISPEVVRRNAAEFDNTFDDEMALIVTHGVLHLLGYDHVEDDDAATMEERETALLAAAGRVRR